MPGIGVLSTISFRANNAPWEAAFRNGLGNAAWYVPGALQENIGFGQAALQTALTNLNNNGNVFKVISRKVVPLICCLIHRCVSGARICLSKKSLSIWGPGAILAVPPCKICTVQFFWQNGNSANCCSDAYYEVSELHL
jgi:hypothetical protein